MAKKDLGANIQDTPLNECLFHYNQWRDDNDNRRTRPNGWDAITDAYWGKLPDDWPYDSRVVDPRIRTTVIEKDARLLNNKLRGRLVPREGGDMLSARVNNALLEFQWDNANHGGTMLSKWKRTSQDTRLYASAFAYVCWKHEKDEDEILFDGNEFVPLDVRDSGLDPTCTNIRDAKWFQRREWAKVEDLEKDSKLYPGLSQLRSKLADRGSGGDRRDNAYQNRILQLKGLNDRVGNDRVFPTVEIVTEYRTDRWITFAPKYKVVLRDIKNPYDHHRIPIVQLTYYRITGDPWGESEIEPVLPLWRAIQANLCGYLDTMNIHMRPPLKIIEDQVRIETIVFGPEAQWLMNRQDSVMEYQGSPQPMQLFQTTHSALVQNFNNAMGDISQGVSNIDNTNPDKTATEIKQSTTQQNSRDQDNQNQLAEAIEDMMGMWLSNNRQFLFADKNKQEYILRILGSELFAYFKKAGMDEMELTPEAMQTIGDIITQQGGNLSEGDMNSLIEAGKTPKFPVYDNAYEENPSEIMAKTKMRVNDVGDGAEMSLVPEDLVGSYDYIADVKSMAIGANDALTKGLHQALEMITTNPQVAQMLMQEGVQPKIKDLFIAVLEQDGLNDAERFFPPAPPPEPANFNPMVPDPNIVNGGQDGVQLANGQVQTQGQPTQGNVSPQPLPQQGLPGGASTDPSGIMSGQGGGPLQLPQ